MPSTLSKSLLTFALLVIAVVSWQWIDERDVQPRADSNTIQMVETRSDYYLENFEIVNIANSGNPTTDGKTIGSYLKITGQSLSHHYIEGYSLINNPTVHLRSSDGGQWQASASNGTVSANFDVLDLQNNVEIKHNQSRGRSEVTVNTNSISIDNGSRTISSSETVQVNGHGWQYNANTMHAEIDKGTLSFTSGVEAQFANPNQR